MKSPIKIILKVFVVLILLGGTDIDGACGQLRQKGAKK